MTEVRESLATLLQWAGVVVVATFVLYVLAMPLLGKRPRRTQNLALIVAFLIAVVLSLTWFQQPMTVIYDTNAAP